MYLPHWHGWCHTKLLPSRRVLCTPCNHAPCYFMQSHIRKVYACLAVTCHLHFWQNDQGLLRATAVTQGWNGYRNKSQHRKLTLENKFSRRSSRDSNPQPFDHKSGALTTELSLLLRIPLQQSMTAKLFRILPSKESLDVQTTANLPILFPRGLRLWRHGSSVLNKLCRSD